MVGPHFGIDTGLSFACRHLVAVVARLSRLQRLFGALHSGCPLIVSLPLRAMSGRLLMNIHRIATYLLIAVRLHYGVSAYLFLHSWKWFDHRKSHCGIFRSSHTLKRVLVCRPMEPPIRYSIEILPPTCDAGNLWILLPNSHSLACACPS